MLYITVTLLVDVSSCLLEYLLIKVCNLVSKLSKSVINFRIWHHHLYYIYNVQFVSHDNYIIQETCDIPISLVTHCSSTTLRASFMDPYLGR